ncbi:tetraspanin-8-like [Esox lucius]|uniref:tetraspanin-8-like n=1 Tax=Esox lucius TaxID=8010 RepID=UPI0014773BDF|nr:tetraspanin-8-like [Esox lucius]
MAVDKCIKYLLFFFNLLFCISGCFILGISIYLKVSSKTWFMGVVPGVDLLIAASVIIMVLGFLGCCGAIRENRIILMLFFILLLLIFILLLIAAILGAVGVNKTEESMKEWIKANLPLRNQTSKFQADMQKLEEQEKCCGLINGPSDWGSAVPNSCQCDNTTQECQLANGQQAYAKPCIKVLMIEMVKQALIILVIAFVLAVLLIFGMVLSMTLYCQTGKNDDYIAH